MMALHGFLGTPSDWARVSALREAETPNWLPQLSAIAKCSQSPATQSVLPALAEQLTEDYRMIATGRPVLAGYSMGGRIALHLLTLPQAGWTHAVIVSASPGIVDPSERQRRFEHDLAWAKRFRNRPDGESVNASSEETWSDLVRDWDAQPVFDADRAYAKREPPDEAHFKRDDLANALEWGSIGLQADLRGALRDTRAKVLWVAGELDSKYRDLAKECAALNPNFSCSIIPGAGHRILASHPHELSTVVESFLATKL